MKSLPRHVAASLAALALPRHVAASLAALALAGALAGTSVAQDFSGPEFDAAVRSYIERNPQVLLDSINAHVAAQQQAERDAQDAAFLTMADEFLQGENLPVAGNPDGSVTMVYVLDAACTYCRRMTPVIAELIADNPELRIVQHWASFLTPASEYSARVVEIVRERYPDSYADFYHTLMMQTAALDIATVDRVIAQVIGEDALASIRLDNTGAEGARIAAAVAANVERLHRARIDGTPFFYVDGVGAEGIFRGAVPSNLIQAALDKAGARE